MAKSNKIYLDYAASVSANPSSIHSFGVEAKSKLQKARSETANILGARAEEIIFTSGGTESNNLAVQGVVIQNLTAKPHIITTNIEHPSVLETFKILQKRKLAEISIVPVEKNGIVDPKKIRKEIKNNTVLVSVMYANNEIGTIQPIREIAKEIRHFRKTQKVSFSNFKRSVLKSSKRTDLNKVFPLFHTDAVQAVNYLDLNVEKLGVDLLSISGSKIEGAGKIGVLYKRKSVLLASVFGGGDQEFGLRPGTENLSEILKFSKALKLIEKNKEQENKRLTELRDYFFKKLLKNQKQKFSRVLGSPGPRTPARPLENFVFDFLVNGDLENRLPNNINITFPKIPSELLVIELSAKGIMASSKSACKSSSKEGSYVIQAINPELDPEIGGVRFSMGKLTTKADIDYTIKALLQILKKLKKWYN